MNLLQKKTLYILLFLPLFTNAQVFKVGDLLAGYMNTNDTLINYTYADSESYFFDINNDTQNDFELKAYSSISPGGGINFINIYSLNANSFSRFGRTDSVLLNSTPPHYIYAQVAKPLILGDTINSLNADWKNTALSITNSSWFGNAYFNVVDWIGQNDLFIGLMYRSINDTIYGYVRVNCPTSKKCYLKEYSFSKCLSSPPMVTSSDSLSCTHEPVTLSASGAGPYTWSTGATGSSIVVNPNVTTTYTVEGTNIYGCYGTAAITQSVANTPSLTVTSATNVSCASEPVVITVSGAGSYNWSTGSTDSSITVMPTIITTYTVEGTNIYGCSATAMITQSVVTCAGIREYDNYEINIYPNPTATILHIADAENNFANADIEVINYLGQRVSLQEYANRIDVSKLPTGIYTLIIKTQDNKNYYSKFIKER